MHVYAILTILFFFCHKQFKLLEYSGLLKRKAQKYFNEKKK